MFCAISSCPCAALHRTRAFLPTRAFVYSRYFLLHAQELYHILYTMATQKLPHNFSAELYQRHSDTIRQYLKTAVLPAIRHKRGTFLLKELVARWELHKVMNRWMFKVFQYLDRYYVEHHNLPTLQEAGLRVFKVEIFEVIKNELTLSGASYMRYGAFI